MAFLLQPQQSADLTYKPCPGGQIVGKVKFVINPTQSIDKFPLEVLDTVFPTGFTNTGSFQQYFDIDGWLYIPDNWNPHGWFKMIHKSFSPISGNVFQYTWGPANYMVTVTLK